MVKPNCPSYTMEVDIECIDGVLSSTRAVIKFNNIAIDLNVDGLGSINSCTSTDPDPTDEADCIAISMTGFVLTWKDPNDPMISVFYNYIGQQCLCITDCKPIPLPPCIPIPRHVNAIQNIAINNGVFIKNTATIETFEIVNITTQDIIPLTSCVIQEIAPFIPENINIGPSAIVSCYDTVNIVSDIIFTKDYLIVVKSNIKILSINNPISDLVVNTIISCDQQPLPGTEPSNILVSNNQCDGYSNTENIIVMTDIYIENNILKYRTANITVTKIITSNNPSNIILLTDCLQQQ